MKNYLRTMLEKLKHNKEVTTYQIAKETGLHYSAVSRFRSSEFNLGNITLDAAERYATFQEIYEAQQIIEKNVTD